MEQRNEPTTAEIVRGLQRIAGDFHIDFGGFAWAVDDAADRLERLERDNAALKSRAEKAEADRDAAIADAEKAPSCGVCDHADCQYCFHGDMFTWRGLRGEENNGKD